MQNSVHVLAQEPSHGIETLSHMDEGAIAVAEEQKKSDRVRLIIDTDESVRTAVSLRAVKLTAVRGHKISQSDVVNEILNSALANEISEVTNMGESRSKKKR